MFRSKKFSVIIVLFLIVILLMAHEAIAQEAKKDTLYLNNLIEREFQIHQNIVDFNNRFGDFNTWNYSVYHYRSPFEINQQLYNNLSKLTLKRRDRIKVIDRVYFSIHNEYIPGFMQLYKMPITKSPENPNLIYENEEN